MIHNFRKSRNDWRRQLLTIQSNVLRKFSPPREDLMLNRYRKREYRHGDAVVDLFSALFRLQEDPPTGVSGAPTDNNIMIWNAVIFGPHDTPFEDGTFKLTIEFTEEYPNKPPTVRFVSKMFHPNVYADGGICLDILQNRWSPTYDVSAILTSIQVSWRPRVTESSLYRCASSDLPSQMAPSHDRARVRHCLSEGAHNSVRELTLSRMCSLRGRHFAKTFNEVIACTTLTSTFVSCN